ncbi:uncharacterized protein LOC132904363 [Amyelois transitella]|uniref:uncharacterized protein LOC132904363 n=1 Tax=Amyelois transitella TaxID=680683 RepID=UPI0029901299|nr:uncharacterized protein LOC132904363 [Amyelois transitella]
MANTTKYKVESGVQLLARLLKRTDNIENFYPALFETGPKSGETIEMFSQISLNPLLTDLICEALLPSKFGGPQLGVLLFSTDGNMDYNMLFCCLKNKLLYKTHDIDNMEKFLHDVLSNLVILKIYDATQFYTTINNIENIMMDYPHISLVIFHTLTAFYWSEQGFKITKMDFYIKNLLQLIKRVTKDYKITLIYTRPEYFSTNKDSTEDLEACSEHPSVDMVNYKIQLFHINDNCTKYKINVKKINNLYVKYFNIQDKQLNWILE